MLRKWGSVAAAAALFVSASSAAFAADNSQQTQQGALKAGAPAGVHEAQMFMGPNTLLWFLGLGVVAGGIALATSGNGNGTPATTTTSTTGP